MGKSAVAASAYRAGEKIKNEYDGIEHDYTRRGGVSHTQIMLPENAPAEYSDRAVLWNAVERVEKAKNSQLAREIEIALPVELSEIQNRVLVQEYVRGQFVEHGMCADIAIHKADDGNPHAHIMLTMRPFNNDGTWGNKQKKVYHLDENDEKIYDPKKRQYKCGKVQTTDWHEQTKAEEWRAAWADAVNHALEQRGHAERIDHRSFDRQGIEQIPTIHLGVAASQMEQKGIRTERGDVNREIASINLQIQHLAAKIDELQTWLEEEKANEQPPTFADLIADILSRQGQIVADKATAHQILKFLTNKHIEDYTGFENYMKDLIGSQRDLVHEMKPIREKLDAVTECIAYKKYKAKYDTYIKEYNSQKPWKRKAFEEDNRSIISNWESSKRYIKSVLNSKGQVPNLTWQKEQTVLLMELKELKRAHERLKSEVTSVDKIRNKVYDIMRREKQREQLCHVRAYGMEL